MEDIKNVKSVSGKFVKVAAFSDYKLDYEMARAFRKLP